MKDIDKRLEEAGAGIRAEASMLPLRGVPRSRLRNGARVAVAAAAVTLAALFIVVPSLWISTPTKGADGGAGAPTVAVPSTATDPTGITSGLASAGEEAPPEATIEDGLDAESGFPYLGISGADWSIVGVSEESQGVYDGGVVVVESTYQRSLAGISQTFRLSMAKHNPQHGPFFGAEVSGEGRVLEELEELAVRGHPATLLGSERDSVLELFLLWSENDEVDVFLATTGIDREELLELAANLEPIPSEVWNQMLAAHQTAATSVPASTTTSTAPDGNTP